MEIKFMAFISILQLEMHKLANCIEKTRSHQWNLVRYIVRTANKNAKNVWLTFWRTDQVDLAGI